MKYVAILETVNELPEEVIEDLKKTTFFDNKNAVCLFDITSIKPAPEKAHYDSSWGNFHYNRALKDCGVIEEMEREEELEQTIDELNYDLTNAFEKIKRLESGIKKAREEIAVYYENATDAKQKTAFNACLMVIDDLISGSEEQNDLQRKNR